MATYEEERETAKQLEAELVKAFPGMDTRLRHALAERGHGPAAVRTMGPQRTFAEFCDWEGLIGWGGTLAAVLDSARKVLK